MKKIEPTKNTVPSVAEPTSCAKPGIGPSTKQTEPIANRTPIHHEALRPTGRPLLESREACLRWKRESQIAVAPSPVLYSTLVVNGPTAVRSVTDHPSGVRG